MMPGLVLGRDWLDMSRDGDGKDGFEGTAGSSAALLVSVGRRCWLPRSTEPFIWADLRSGRLFFTRRPELAELYRAPMSDVDALRPCTDAPPSNESSRWEFMKSSYAFDERYAELEWLERD